MRAGKKSRYVYRYLKPKGLVVVLRLLGSENNENNDKEGANNERQEQ